MTFYPERTWRRTCRPSGARRGGRRSSRQRHRHLRVRRGARRRDEMTSGLDCVEEAAGGPGQEREAVGRAPLISPATRAGVVTRPLAAAVDVALAAAMVVLVYLAVVATRFAWSPLTFRWPAPSAPLSGAVFAAVA